MVGLSHDFFFFSSSLVTMGRTRRPNKTTLATNKIVPATHNPMPNVPTLLQKAQTLISQCDYPLALRFIQRVLEIDQSNLEAQELKGIAEIESGDVDCAKLVRGSWFVYPEETGTKHDQ
jgi:hypothetical protein